MAEPWVRFEDEHVLAVAKPAGVNTHRADVHAQDGMYEWVQRQRPASKLSVLHRLDKETSGLLLFGKGRDANRSLAAQFERRAVGKRYVMLSDASTDGPGAGAPESRCEQPIGGRAASTSFVLESSAAGRQRWAAFPHSGRTHQVRIHTQTLGRPIIGDPEHGGTEAPRLFLHAEGLGFTHPTTGESIDLVDPCPPSFDLALAGTDRSRFESVAALAALESRTALFDRDDTDCFLWIDRGHDGFDDVRVELLGDVALILDYGNDGRPISGLLDALHDHVDLSAVYRQPRPRGGGAAPAQRVAGDGPERFEVREHGCRYLIDLGASATSSGLFLDQRETRRRLLNADLSGRTVLNTFAHTGALSVAAARAGAETLTLDLSKHYLERARANLAANAVDPGRHDFMYGDALEWMQRFAKKGRTFDLVITDPPSSSTARKRGAKRWSVERDLHVLVERAANLGAAGGTVFVSTNLRRMTWPNFFAQVDRGLAAAGRSGEAESQTLPLDHRSGPGDPPYLKAAWITLD